jgi:hypothetical protein
MIVVPVRIPKNSDEITSLSKRAIMIATNGGKIDIQSGIIKNIWYKNTNILTILAYKCHFGFIFA